MTTSSCDENASSSFYGGLSSSSRTSLGTENRVGCFLSLALLLIFMFELLVFVLTIQWLSKLLVSVVLLAEISW